MSDAKLHRRRCAHGSANDNDLLQVQRIQQAGVGVGLGRRRCVRRHGGTEIAESRRHNHSESSSEEVAREVQALVETTAGAVNRKNGRSGPDVRVFDHAAGSIDDLAA